MKTCHALIVVLWFVAAGGCSTATYPDSLYVGYHRDGTPGKTIGQVFAEGQPLQELIDKWNDGSDEWDTGYAPLLHEWYGHGPITMEEVVTALRLLSEEDAKNWPPGALSVYRRIERTRRVPQGGQLSLTRFPHSGEGPYPYQVTLDTSWGYLAVRSARP